MKLEYYLIIGAASFVAWAFRANIIGMLPKLPFVKSKAPDHEKLNSLLFQLAEGCAECGITEAVELLKPVAPLLLGHKHEGDS